MKNLFFAAKSVNSILKNGFENAPLLKVYPLSGLIEGKNFEGRYSENNNDIRFVEHDGKGGYDNLNNFHLKIVKNAMEFGERYISDVGELSETNGNFDYQLNVLKSKVVSLETVKRLHYIVDNQITFQTAINMEQESLMRNLGGNGLAMLYIKNSLKTIFNSISDVFEPRDYTLMGINLVKEISR